MLRTNRMLRFDLSLENDNIFQLNGESARVSLPSVIVFVYLKLMNPLFQSKRIRLLTLSCNLDFKP